MKGLEQRNGAEVDRAQVLVDWSHKSQGKSVFLRFWAVWDLSIPLPSSTWVAALIPTELKDMDQIVMYIVATAKLHQSCPTLCDPVDGSPPGSPVPGILQARTLEWVAISFSNAWKSKVKVKSLSHIWLLATPWTAAYQAPVHGIFQARVLEWGAIAFSMCMLSRFKFFVTPWAVTHQAPLSIEFSSKNTRMGCHALLQGIFLTQESNPHLLYLLHLQVGSLQLAPLRKSREWQQCMSKKNEGGSFWNLWMLGNVASH